MILSFGISWFCILWGCICFPSLQGYNIAPGYSLSDDGFSSHAGVLSPQSSNQFHSGGASLNTNHDLVSPEDEIQAMRDQSFVSPQQEPLHHESNEDASSFTSLSEEMVQNKPDSGHEPDEFSAVPSVQKYHHESSGNPHPFGLLVTEHTQKKTMEGVSFPTMKDFKQFIETMKSSFLTPGSDLRRHFQTAQEIMNNEVASNAQKMEEESDTGYRSDPAKEGTAHDETSENEVWNELMNTVFEQSEQGTNNPLLSESLSVPIPVDSTASLITTNLNDNQGLGPGYALYTHPHLEVTEPVSRNYENYDNDGISGEKPEVFISAPDVKNKDVGSMSYKLPAQIPSGTFFGEDFSFSGHVTASPVNPQNSSSQDFNYYSSKISDITPHVSEKTIPKPKYTFQSKDYLTGYQKPSSSLELEDFQSEELGRVTPANVLSAPNPPSLNSYSKSVYVSAPRRQHYILDYQPKRRQRPAPSFQPDQLPVGEESKDINYTPTVHQPLSSDSVSLSSHNLSTQKSSGYVGVQTSSPHDAQKQSLNKKQPVRSHQVFTVKPSSLINGFLRDQIVSVTHPSILTDQAKDEKRSDLSEQNPVSTIQEPKQMTDHTQTALPGVLHLTQTGISSTAGIDYASFNSETNLAPMSASETAFSRLYGIGAMSRNSKIKNMSDRFPTGDIHGAVHSLGSFSTPQRRGTSLNGDYVGANRADFPQNSLLLTKIWNHPANPIKEPSNMAYWQPEPWSTSKVSGSTFSGVFGRTRGNRKRLPPKKGPSNSAPSVNTYVVKSRKSYVRGKMYLSKTHYAPYQLGEDKTGEHQ